MWKNENKQKEAGIGPFLNKMNHPYPAALPFIFIVLNFFGE